MSDYERHILGNNGEKIASEYLEKNHYEIIKRNFRCKQGEIDIIAYDNKNREYVFVEVKTRTNFEYGKPVDSVNKMKQKHIVSATKYYMYLHNLENKYIRFDIIEIYKKDQYIINHIKNVEINQ
jgi:putative endonuclease